MTIQNWPKHDRPRERLIQHGPQTLSDAELLAIFLRTGLPGKSAVELAHEMLSKFGGLSQLNTIELGKWKEIKGLGEAKFAQLKAAIELARRSLGQELKDSEAALSDPAAFARFAQLQIGLSPVEQFLVIALNSQLQVIDHKILSTGTVNKAVVFPREVAKFALLNNAPRLMVAHNHPSGCCTPSDADDRLTRNLQDALQLIEVELVDHLVVSAHQHYSYRAMARAPF